MTQLIDDRRPDAAREASGEADAEDGHFLASLRAAAGADAVLTDPAQRTFFSADVAQRGVAAEAVVRIADLDVLVRVVRACTTAGRIVIPRGGGFSYTGGYTPTRARSVELDLRPMNRIVEINTTDMFVVVESGCTWERLYAALKAQGVRTPYFGPMSGYRATIGGALSQGSFFLGSTEHGTVAESVLGLQLVLADGTVLKTGSFASKEGGSPFFRQYGPDATGLFLGDNGAMGFKAQIVLRLIPFPAAQAYGSFAFTTHGAALEAVSAVGRAALAAECYCWDPYFVTLMASASTGTKEDLRFLLNVVRAGSGWLDGLAGAARIALAGKRVFSGDTWLMHVVIDDASAAGAAAKLKRVRALAKAAGGAEISPSAPRALRGTPFTDFNVPERRTTLRNLPVNSLSPHSRAPAVADAVYRYLADNRADMARLNIACGVIFFAVGAQAVGIEPLIYWHDEEHFLHDRIAEKSDLERLSHYEARPEATQMAFALREGLKAIFRANGCAHLQIARAYPWAETREAATLELIAAVKNHLDPHHLVNRGVLGLPGRPRDIAPYPSRGRLELQNRSCMMPSRLAALALVVGLPAWHAHAAPACSPVSPFNLSLDHLDGFRVFTGPDGESRIEALHIPSTAVPMLKTGKTLYEIALPTAPKRNVQIVIGPADVAIPFHPAPYKEMFVLLGGSSTITTKTQKGELSAGSVLLLDDATSKTGHGGSSGPCGYIALSIAP